MKVKGFRQLAVLALLALFSVSGQAQLYKWVDEDGNVFYSDKVPEGTKGSEVTTGNSIGSAPKAQQSTAKPIIRPYEKTARRLHILDTRYRWKREAESSQTSKIGVYHVGKGCVSRGAITTPDAFIHHKSFFPSERRMTKSINKVVLGLDYEAEQTDKYRLLDRLKKTGGLSLHAEIVEMKIKTCAPNIRDSERLLPVEEIRASRFYRNKVNLQVQWQVRDNRDQDVIYETVTAGSYNGWHQQTSPHNAISNALEAATLQLFTDADLVASVLVEEDRSPPGDITVASLQPIRSSGKTAALYVAVDHSNWTSNKSNNSEIGNMLFGENCTAARPLPLGFALANNRWLEPKTQKISNSIVNRARPLGYAVNPATPDTLQQLQKSTGYSLNAKLYKLSYDTCAPSMSASSKYKPIGELSSRKMNRNRLHVWIEWELKADRNRMLLYRSSTMGFAGDLVTKNAGDQVLNAAIGMATEQLFADPKFIDMLAVEGRALPKNEPFADQSGSSVKGIVLGPKQTAQKLILVSATDPWQSLDQDQIGQYAFGPDCTPFQQRQWPQALNEQSRHFSSGATIAVSQHKVIRSLGYDVQITNEYDALKLKRRLKLPSLQGQLVRLRFDSCAPELDENVVFSDRQISARRFQRHRVIVTVHWQLIDAAEDKLLHETTVSGVADSWQLNSRGQDVVGLAIEDATNRLFAQPRFIAQITDTPEEEKSFFGELFSMFESEPAAEAAMPKPETPEDWVIHNAMVKADASRAYSELHRVRLSMQTHYQTEGEWPDSLDSLGYAPDAFYSVPQIEDVFVSADGSIVADLAKNFGEAKTITLQPNGESWREWRCSSNLKQQHLPASCEQER